MSGKRVTGIGGIFFKSKDPKSLARWYAEHLDLDVQDWGGALFRSKRVDSGEEVYSVWAPFAEDTGYFLPSKNPYMINLRVDDLHAVLEALRAEGCTVLDRFEESEQGKFGYVVDPEGAVVELWQPAATDTGNA